MGILRFTVSLILKLAAALAAAAAALWLLGSFMVVEVESTNMLPFLEPGQKVIASRTDIEEFRQGDLIVYEAPYYCTDGEGRYLIRCVSGVSGEKIEVTAGSYALGHQDREVIEKDIILGKVIRTWVKENAN